MSSKTIIRQDNGSIIVESDIIALKLDTNRIVYAQRKYESDNSFKKINILPREVRKSSQKQMFLLQMHQIMQDKVLSDPVNQEKFNQKPIDDNSPTDESHSDDYSPSNDNEPVTNISVHSCEHDDEE